MLEKTIFTFQLNYMHTHTYSTYGYMPIPNHSRSTFHPKLISYSVLLSDVYRRNNSTLDRWRIQRLTFSFHVHWCCLCIQRRYGRLQIHLRLTLHFGLKTNADKCNFGGSKVNYFGKEIDQEVISPLPNNIEAI